MEARAVLTKGPQELRWRGFRIAFDREWPWGLLAVALTTAVSLSLSQAVRPATSDAATRDALRICFLILI